MSNITFRSIFVKTTLQCAMLVPLNPGPPGSPGPPGPPEGPGGPMGPGSPF